MQEVGRGLFGCLLKDPNLPACSGRSEHNEIVSAQIPGCEQLAVAIDAFHIIDMVNHLEGETVRRIEDDPQVMGAIPIDGMDPEAALLGDGCAEDFACGSGEILVEELGLIVSERLTQALPGLQVIADDGLSGAGLDGPGSVKIGRRDRDRGLAGTGSERDGAGEGDYGGTAKEAVDPSLHQCRFSHLI